MLFLQDLMTDKAGTLADHLRHVGAVDEEDLIVAIEHRGEVASIIDIWRSPLAGKRSICFWCRLSLGASDNSTSGMVGCFTQPWAQR